MTVTLKGFSMFVFRVVVVTVFFASLTDHLALAQGPPPAPVVVSPVIKKEVRAGQTFVGTIVPEQKAIIGSAVDGRVVEFPVNEGDRVKSGDALAKLLTATITLELEAAQGELTLREEELAELKNGTRPEEIAQAKAQVKAAEAGLELSRKRVTRIQNLVRSGNAATQEQLDEALASAENALAVLQERTAAYDLAVAGPRKEQIAQAEARVAIQKAVVEKLADQITKHTMFARFDGFVSAEHTEVGEWVNRGAPVAEIIGIDRVDIVANVLESHIPYIQVGTRATIEVPAIPNRLFHGDVVIIVPEGDSRSRTFPVKVRLTNEFEGDKPLLNPGMLARMTLPTGPTTSSVLIPKDALVLGGQSPLVYVIVDVEAGQSVRPVPVQISAPSGTLTAVIADLQEGDKVVVRGNERLRPMQPVKVIEEIQPE